MVELTERDGAVLLPVKVVPGASRTRIVGPLGGRLKVTVAAPPEKGKANAELRAFLARKLRLHRPDLTVEKGATSQTKIVRIEGMSAAGVAEALGLNPTSPR